MHDSLHVRWGDTANRCRGPHHAPHDSLGEVGGEGGVWNHVLAPEISDVILEAFLSQRNFPFLCIWILIRLNGICDEELYENS